MFEGHNRSSVLQLVYQFAHFIKFDLIFGTARIKSNGWLLNNLVGIVVKLIHSSVIYRLQMSMKKSLALVVSSELSIQKIMVHMDRVNIITSISD